MKIPLHKVDFTQIETNEVQASLSMNRDKYNYNVETFEKRVAEFIGVSFAVAVNSGTSGLHLAVKSIGIKEGDEVFTTPFSSIASANCMLYENAIPVFVDINRNTLTIDPNKLEDKIRDRKKTNANIKAILLVHIFGHPCDLDALMELADKYDLDIIEDACNALGSEYRSDSLPDKNKVGNFGAVSVFGFSSDMQLTTGEGGIVVTDDDNIAKLCRSFRDHGRNSEDYALNRLGYDYRIGDLNCALGIAQMQRINEILRKRSNVANLYNKKLSNIEGFKLPYTGVNVDINWSSYVIRLDEVFGREKRDKIITEMAKKGIECSSCFAPIHLQPFYKERFDYKKGDFPISEFVAERIIALPFYGDLREEEIDYIADNLANIIKNALE